MQPLFTTYITYSFEEYSKFNKMYLKKIQKFPQKLIISEIFILILAILLLFLETYSLATFLIIFIIIYPIILFSKFNKEIKKTYTSNKSIDNVTYNYQFFNNYFIATSSNSETKIEFSKLFKIVETKDRFYLMIAKNQGYIVSKGDNQDFINYINSIQL